MPAFDMCSAWNRILTEPPGSDIYRRLANALRLRHGSPDVARWHAWPVDAVLSARLPYAEAVMTRRDFEDLLGAKAEPTARGLRQAIKDGGLELKLVTHQSEVDKVEGITRLHIARNETLEALWDMDMVIDAYRRVLPSHLAARQESGLQFYRKCPVSHFASHGSELKMVEWAVLGLILGHDPGLTAVLILSTSGYLDSHSLKHSFVF
ncbi:hypothetical protein [Nonomuraea sp. KM90]|uniref:hypothetical protein n=1 Tax=Nonomuraea sp. KM90 TaxID=3457428 RepID=UPI003FCC2C0A